MLCNNTWSRRYVQNIIRIPSRTPEYILLLLSIKCPQSTIAVHFSCKNKRKYTEFPFRGSRYCHTFIFGLFLSLIKDIFKKLYYTSYYKKDKSILQQHKRKCHPQNLGAFFCGSTNVHILKLQSFNIFPTGRLFWTRRSSPPS